MVIFETSPGNTSASTYMGIPCVIASGVSNFFSYVAQRACPVAPHFKITFQPFMMLIINKF